MYLLDLIRDEMAALVEEDLAMSESVTEEELEDRSLECGVMDRPLPDHHRRLWTLYERKVHEVQTGAEQLRQEAQEGLDEAELNARAAELAGLKRVADIVNETFWEDTQREFPELRRHESLVLLEGWLVGWTVPHPCLDCPVRRECDARYGSTHPAERHELMEKDGWDPSSIAMRNNLAQAMGLDPEDLEDMGFEVLDLGASDTDDPDTGEMPADEDGDEDEEHGSTVIIFGSSGDDEDEGE